MPERKYIGVPTQEEIIQQYEELVAMTKHITTLEEVLQFKKTNKEKGIWVDIEINYDILREYKGEPIEVIRYEYKNILVYANIKEGKAVHNPFITLYSDEGDTQFADSKYDDYTAEIERVANMGLLELAK